MEGGGGGEDKFSSGPSNRGSCLSEREKFELKMLDKNDRPVEFELFNRQQFSNQFYRILKTNKTGYLIENKKTAEADVLFQDPDKETGK